MLPYLFRYRLHPIFLFLEDQAELGETICNKNRLERLSAPDRTGLNVHSLMPHCSSLSFDD